MKPDAKEIHPVKAVVPVPPALLMAARPRPVDPMPNASQSQELDSASVLQNSPMESLILDAQLDLEVI